jgi:rhodanese-related sulfurtransferase
LKNILADDLAGLLESKGECALFDVREAGEADRGHVFGATFLPRRLIEQRIADLVGDPATPVVVYDEGGPRAARAALTLERLGYRDVRVLAAGTRGWLESGRRLTEGSNVPSKLFGEEVYETTHVPQLPVETLKAWQDEGKPHIVCDIRTPDEYAVARIPGAHGAFGVDLARLAGDLRARDLPIVVHCAGRTRSIIACQSLRELGVENVQALENGTMGWQVAGHELERGNPRGVLEPSTASIQYGEARTRDLALAAGVGEIGVDELDSWLAEREAGRSNTYVIDVRQVDDYVAGHVPGAIALPGGLAIQRTDEFAPVRAARMVMIDDLSARAFLTAYWLRKIGRPRVYVLKGGLQAWRGAGRAVASGRTRNRPAGLDQARNHAVFISPVELAALPRALVVDIDTSREYKRARVPGAQWIPYGWLEERVGAVKRETDDPMVLTCHNGILSTFAAATLGQMGVANLRVLEGGVAAWSRAGLATDSGWPAHMAPADDLVVPPYHSNREAMARYLAWEQKLTAERGSAH